MRYQYTGYGAFYQGLPAADLDDDDLSDDQKALLTIAIAAKLYVPEIGANQGQDATEAPTQVVEPQTNASAGKSAKGKANAIAEPTPEAASLETPTEGTSNA